jgi:hypothetical protein
MEEYKNVLCTNFDISIVFRVYNESNNAIKKCFDVETDFTKLDNYKYEIIVK